MHPDTSPLTIRYHPLITSLPCRGMAKLHQCDHYTVTGQPCLLIEAVGLAMIKIIKIIKALCAIFSSDLFRYLSLISRQYATGPHCYLINKN